MKSLELKIPPPLVALLIATAMWGVAQISPVLDFAALYRVSAAIAIAIIGGGFSIAGVIAFRQARTTVNPLKPESTSALVSLGVYRITRNPMYVGMLLAVLAWAVFLAAPWALIGPVAFHLYIGRFQIAPEETVLTKLFGAEYVAYKTEVRRWL